MNFYNIALNGLRSVGFDNKIKLTLQNSGINKVFIDEENDLVIKIHTENNLNKIKNEVYFSIFLKKNNFSSSEVLGFKNEYIFKINGFYITFWKKIKYNDNYLNMFKLGKTIKEFHNVTFNYQSKCEYSIIKNLEYMINRDKNKLDSNFIKRIDIEFNKLKKEFILVQDNLNNKISHGDLHIGNFLCTRNKIYLIDFELMGNLDSRIDLVSIYFTYLVFENNINKYNDFVNGYGFDVRNWKYFELFFNLQKTFSCAWLFFKYIEDRSHGFELERRLSSLEEKTDIIFKSAI